MSMRVRVERTRRERMQRATPYDIAQANDMARLRLDASLRRLEAMRASSRRAPSTDRMSGSMARGKYEGDDAGPKPTSTDEGQGQQPYREKPSADPGRGKAIASNGRRVAAEARTGAGGDQLGAQSSTA